MSAYVVSKAQIDYILTAAKPEVVWSRTRNQYLDVNGIGDVIWKENQRSVNYRYSEDNTVPEYQYQQTQVPVSAIQALKFIQCLDYQSCETEDWESTEAAGLLRRLQSDIMGCLPGYKEAAWSI